MNTQIWIGGTRKMFDKSNKLIALTGVLLLGCMIAVVVVTTCLFSSNIEVLSDPKIESGVIVDKYDYISLDSGNTSEVYMIVYEKVVDGKKVQRKDRVTSVTYSSYKVGDTFERKNHINK